MKIKKLLTIVSLFSFFFLFSQNEVGKKVKELQENKTIFKSFSVLNLTQDVPSYEVNKVVSKATFATINSETVNEIFINKYDNIELEIPYNNQVLTVTLYKVIIFSDGFHLDSDKQKNIPYQKGVYYRGILKNDYTSVASFSFFNNEFNGVVSATGLSNVVVGKLAKPNNTLDYIIYADENLKVLNDFQCNVKDNETLHSNDSNSNQNKDINSTRCVSMYFEIDYNLFQNNGSDVAVTTNWMTSVFNNVQTLYANDAITVAIKSLYIWTSLDPYQGIGPLSTDYLYKFNQVRPVFDGDVGQLVGIDTGSLGGVAVSINGLCTLDNFSYSDVNFAYETVPTYSWTILVITHELGHLLGSRHTHACAWNGNNTAIDGCGQQAGYQEGTCANGPIPSAIVKGTIMSYCHLISGVGVNFNNGFGIQPKQKILTAVNSGTCLSTDCVTTCINTVSSINILNVTTTTATINWVETGNFTSWRVAVYAFGSTSIIYETVTTNSFTATGLSPNSYYVVEVKPNCTNGLIGASRQLIFVTSTSYCDGVTIADTGGTTDNYTNMETSVRIMIPEITNYNMTLTFTAFALELDYDYLYVYDGNSIAAPLLNAGGATGNTIPGPFTSTASDGSLTMKFFSDQGLVDAGFIATTSCSPNLGLNNFNGIDFTYYPNPTNGIININSKTTISSISVYNVTGQLLYSSYKNDLNTTVNIAAYANGTYFFKLKFDEKEVNFKVVKI